MAAGRAAATHLRCPSHSPAVPCTLTRRWPARPAQRALQSGLEKRGFEVLRLNTYDTVPVTQLDAAALEAAKQAAVVTVGSPSAIK